MKRGVTKYNFLIGVDKPSGITSHDVVNRVRHIFGEGRVGHMGTLDPLASGVLLVGVGAANRLNQFLAGHDKAYEVVARFGAATNTYDCEGEVTETCDVPLKFLDEKFASVEIKNLVGKHMQKPPVFSAVKINGKAAYKYARAGKDVEIPAREVEIFKAELIQISECNNSDEQVYVDWKFSVRVSGGTYIRTLVHDLGQQLGCPAHVAELRRTSVGDISVDVCAALDELSVDNFAIIDSTKLLGYKVIVITEEEQNKVQTGQSLTIPDAGINQEDKFSLIYNDKLSAIYVVTSRCVKEESIKIKPLVVFATPVVLS